MTYKIDGFGPNDLLTSEKEGLRRVKVSGRDELVDSSSRGGAFILTDNIPAKAGESVAITAYFDKLSVVHSAVSASGEEVAIRKGVATGTADGIIKSQPLNLVSSNSDDSQGQSFFAVPELSTETVSDGDVGGGVVTDSTQPISAVVTNNSTEDKTISLYIKYYAISDISTLTLLQSDTQIETDTEMSQYG